MESKFKMKACIIGGTGTLGQELIKQLNADITVFSRDELKQRDLRSQFPHVNYVLGDIRDWEALSELFSGSFFDVVFLVAALKQVDTLEFNVKEAVKTNIQGVMNVADACVTNDIPHMVFSSTDKAVLPINTYGMTKAISEHYLYGLNVKQSSTDFSVFRWGNVVGSRGSAIPWWIECLRDGREIQITDERMTRFWISIKDAVSFMLNTYPKGQLDRPNIPFMKAATILRVVQTLAKIIDVDNYKLAFTGIRPGEKIHECILSSHDSCVRSDTADQYTDQELYDLLQPVVETYQ